MIVATKRKSVRPFDRQKENLYQAEQMFQLLGKGMGFSSPKMAQEYVKTLMRTNFWRLRWPDVCRVSVWGAHGEDFQVEEAKKPARGDRMKVPGTPSQFRGFIWLPNWALNEGTLLHEIAHVVTPRKFEGHGAEYAGNLFRLVEYAFGRSDAAELMSWFVAKAVRSRIVRNEVAPFPINCTVL